MKKTINKIALVFLVSTLLILLASSCGSTRTVTTTSTGTETTTLSQTITTTEQITRITDQMDRTVELKSSPQRIISLAPSNTEILFALGLGDRLVGRTDYCNYPPEVLDIPSVGGFSTPNLEEVLALEPDLVLATDIHEEIVTHLEKKNIPVLVLYPKNIGDILDCFELVGQAAGAQAEAAALRSEMEARIKTVTDKSSGLTEAERARACFVVWHDPLMMAGGDTTYNELIEMAGGTNIVSDQSGYPSIDLETVLDANPQVIIIGIGMGEGGDLPLTCMLEEPLLAGTDARQNNRVYPIDQDIVGRFGPRIFDALEQFATFIMYP